MKNVNVFPVIASPVANSNNEALAQAVQAAVDAAKDKKSEGDKSKDKKGKPATEMPNTACFNEITRTAHRIFVKNTPKKFSHLLNEFQLVGLKYEAIKEAYVKFLAKHGEGYGIDQFMEDYRRRVELLAANPVFIEWAEKIGACNCEGNDDVALMRKQIVAQHIVFNGAEFFERVMMNDYLEHGELQIGWHRDYGTPIFYMEKLEKAAAENLEFHNEPVQRLIEAKPAEAQNDAA